VFPIVFTGVFPRVFPRVFTSVSKSVYECFQECLRECFQECLREFFREFFQEFFPASLSSLCDRKIGPGIAMHCVEVIFCAELRNQTMCTVDLMAMVETRPILQALP
jgi:hypothetical protein